MHLPQRPTSTDQLAEFIHTASASDPLPQLRLTGSNSLPLTRFNLSRPLQEISTLRLNKIIEHAIPDMTVIVQAGISLEALQRQLAWQNQWLPIDPPIISNRPGASPNQRTLGGLIATNSLGPLRLSSSGGNDWRLLILGMKWIDASGTLIKGGGRTIKNVAGYNTPRLMIGSAGSLGAIAEITLRTFARPPDEQALILFANTPDQAEELLAQILASPTTPAYLQAVGGKTFSSNPLQLPSTHTGIALIIGFLDRPASCAAQIQTLRNLPAAKSLESISQTAAQAGRLRLWMTTEPNISSYLPTPALGFRIQCLSSEVTLILHAIENLPNSQSWIIAEAATGLIRGSLASPDPFSDLQQLIHTHAPQASLLFTQFLSEPPASTPSDLFLRLKNELDPHALLGLPPA